MSRDGKGEVITRKVEGAPTYEHFMRCGGTVLGHNKARFRRCTNGHTHCMHCLREARRFGKGWTCGICPGRPFGPMLEGVNPCQRCGWSAQFCDCYPIEYPPEALEKIAEIVERRRGDNVRNS